jgi:hypothetical protein
VESGVFDFERYVSHAKKEFSGIWLREMAPK